MYLWDKDKSSWPAWRRGMSSVVGDKLSNSGDALKLLIPNYIRKIICGWTNYSGMVTSQKISEKIMGYRGSKSITVLHAPTSQISGIVKEQRVDGSWYIKSMYLRCTLMGFERNCQVKIPSKQISKATLHTFAAQSKMNPWFFTGMNKGRL